MLKVAVLGAKGRMGSRVCEAITNAADMQLVAQLDQGDDIAAGLKASGATHAVDFTVPTVAQDNTVAVLQAGVHAVVGTTGWDEAAYARIREVAADTGKNALIAPNFAISAVLAMKFAALAAPYFESVEVIELHHPDKVDAPSGTAIATARGIAAARSRAGKEDSPDATETDSWGARGAKIDGVGVHAVRLRGLYASQEVLLGNAGETLSLRADSLDRASFMPGVLLALREVDSHPGLTIGIDSLLGL